MAWSAVPLVQQLPERSWAGGSGRFQDSPCKFWGPQGSILGPILFSVVVADLPCHLPHGRLICYADDTQLLDSSRPDSESLSQLKIRLQESMAAVHNWFRDNSLKMNASKNDFILLGTKQSCKKLLISLSRFLKVPSSPRIQSNCWE